MKTKYIGIILLTIAILSGCSGSSSSGSNAKPVASITITSSNADSVAKGAVSSQAVADTGTASANKVKAASLLADSSNKYSALSLALSHLKTAEGLPFPSSSLTRTIQGWPIKLDCATGGLAAQNQTTNMVTYDMLDNDSSQSISIGDTFSVTYAACVLPSTTITINGGTSLTFNAYHKATTASPSDPDNASITLGYNTFTISNGTETDSLNGNMTMSFIYDGSKLSASMTGSSFTASNSIIGSVTYSGFNLTSTATTTTGTFSADMSISMTPTGGTTGTVNISTPTTFSGPVGGNPTSGQMRIDGANGSYITITAGASTVTIVVYDGTTTSTSTKPWDQI